MFLKELYIKNLATISELKVEFSKNLNLITGETGTGKSIIVDALKILSGKKYDQDIIRFGENQLIVEGVFFNLKEEIKDFLKEKEIEFEDDFLIIRREIYKEKPQRVYINDKICNLKILEELSSKIISIFGQEEEKPLKEEFGYLKLLDLFGGISTEEISKTYENIKKMQNDLKELKEKKEKEDKLREEIVFSIQEIEKANLKENEIEELMNLKLQLKKKEEILNGLKIIINLVEDEEISIIKRLKEAEKALEPLSKNINFCNEVLESIKYAKEAIERAYFISSKEISHFEEGNLSIDEVETRLAKIEILQKKYGKTIEEIKNYCKKAKEKLKEIVNLDEKILKLENALKGEIENFNKKSIELNKKRVSASLKFKDKINKILPKLNLKNAIFEVEVLFDEKKFSPFGKDEVLFKIQTNVGESMLPLEKIASGGELSRIHLAIQEAIEAKKGKVLVFDEVDQGIGGKTSFSVGKLLKEIGKRDQVLCVSHLPQVAIWADKHIKVTKEVEMGRTMTRLEYLEGEERVKEIARMLGGEEYKSAIEHAKKLLESAGEKN